MSVKEKVHFPTLFLFHAKAFYVFILNTNMLLFSSLVSLLFRSVSGVPWFLDK